MERAGFRVERITSFVSFLLPLMMLSRRMRKDHDLWAEFQINRSFNALFETILTMRASPDQERPFLSGGRIPFTSGQKTCLYIVIRIPFNRPFATGKEIDLYAEAIATSKFSGDGRFTADCHRFSSSR